MTGGGKPRPYGFCLTSGKNVGATLAVARKGAPLGGAVCPEGRLRGVPPHFQLPTCPLPSPPCGGATSPSRQKKLTSFRFPLFAENSTMFPPSSSPNRIHFVGFRFGYFGVASELRRKNGPEPLAPVRSIGSCYLIFRTWRFPKNPYSSFLCSERCLRLVLSK